MNLPIRMLRDDSGVAMMEYAIAFAMFALSCAVVFVLVATNAGNRYATSTSMMTTIQESPLPTASP